jgi:hypothetical protein
MAPPLVSLELDRLHQHTPAWPTSTRA